MPATIFTDDVRLQPYWWDAAPCLEETPPALPAKADVVVVGAGYTGLSAALTCARGGRHVVVLDANALGEGASSRNAGFVGRTFTLGFTELCEKAGLDAAKAVYRHGDHAFDYVAHLIENEQIHCLFSRTGRFTGANTPGHYDDMARDAEALRKHLGTEVEMVPRSEQHREIGVDSFHGGQLMLGDAGLHPAMFHQGLLERTRAAGATIAGHTPMTSIVRDGDDFTVTTPRGSIRARHVVIATNGQTGAVTPWLRRRLVSVGAYAVATEPQSPEVMAQIFPSGRLTIDSGKMKYFCRPSPDGSRVLFGGRAFFGGDNYQVTATGLQRAMVRRFPMLEGVRLSHGWGGRVAFSFDRLPHHGNHDGMHYAMGYCGAGLPKGTYLGHKTALDILGEKDTTTPFTDTPFPTLPFYNGWPWFVPALSVYYLLRDRLER